MNPLHSIGFCPVCGGGLCGVRLCGEESPHGLIVCDECEAIWLEPDLSAPHQYPSAQDAKCPICDLPLWGESSRWAGEADLKLLGWEDAIDRQLSQET
ncbi:MAG: hypothetical protein P8L85_14190 [Rubripirellula sp.]|nr:hypothetical protein [Rubripirellula sp.]